MGQERASDTSDELRRVELEDGRVLVVRTARSDDVDGLAAMYDELSDEDIYLRFFTPHRPERDLFERIVHADEKGGAALVAEVVDDDGATIVADAWYSMLPDGDGELAITVAPSWRGWLGSYLLDALLELAAARGVRNLQAEILLRNRGMLALVRRRGCVTVAVPVSAQLAPGEEAPSGSIRQPFPALWCFGLCRCGRPTEFLRTNGRPPAFGSAGWLRLE